FDQKALDAYLQRHVPGFTGPLAVRQFQGGQSNPTFFLTGGQSHYVMRKKPPGPLLPSAHAVDREYKVISALAGSAVPVPRTHCLCLDEAVIGQAFYVMDYVPGRVLTDTLLPDQTPDERRAMYDDLAKVLAALHTVDYAKVGLGDFGKPTDYIRRQFQRWAKQYEASKTDDIPEMDRLMAWIPDRIPAKDESAIVHGDYRLGNVIMHPGEPRIVAVLDWELATLGHPLSDLAYNCMGYHLGPESFRGFGNADLKGLGIPSEAEYLAAYCRHAGRADIPDWNFYIVFSLFRIIAILQGVYKRGLQGNASDATAIERGREAVAIAKETWAIVQRRGGKS
ncbi:MAG: phosphotransferase family protein, partial [Alphaproteobacteria bacterium]|nr:phosphotransferase family protein [Alphaproteobacteria bacterium]